MVTRQVYWNACTCKTKSNCFELPGFTLISFPFGTNSKFPSWYRVPRSELLDGCLQVHLWCDQDQEESIPFLLSDWFFWRKEICFWSWPQKTCDIWEARRKFGEKKRLHYKSHGKGSTFVSFGLFLSRSKPQLLAEFVHQQRGASSLDKKAPAPKFCSCHTICVGRDKALPDRLMKCAFPAPKIHQVIHA